jgi:cytochrome c oxidase subunit 3
MHIRAGYGFRLPPVPAAYSGDGDESDGSLLRRYRLGLALFITGVVMLFVGFSSAYLVRRGIPTYDAASGGYSAVWEPLRLPLGLLLINTALLVSASVSSEIARRRCAFAYTGSGVRKAAFPWIYAAFCLGALFVAGQGLAWRVMGREGELPRTGARTAFFYVLTGAHALHAVIGLVVLAWILVRFTHWTDVRRHIAIDLTGWYLHSMTVLWIYLLCFLLFA